MHWFTRNRADTAGSHADLRPLVVAGEPAAVLARAAEVVRALPRWRVESLDPVALTLAATRRTRLFRFADDVTLRAEPAGDGRTRLHAVSQSRVGKGDFGQNRRNLHELFAALARAGVQ